MNLNDLYEEVARHADTPKLQVTGADTKRVMAAAFQVLAKLDSATAIELLAKGIALGKKKNEPK